MAGGATRLDELRELVGTVDRVWSAASDDDRQGLPFRATIENHIDRCNEITADCLFLASQPIGAYRSGQRKGEAASWGHWTLQSSPAVPVEVEGVECLTDYIPHNRRGKPLSLRWETGRKSKKGTPKAPYLAVDVPGGGWSTRVHRQVWMDVFDCDLPSWIHVDHVQSDYHDCRLSCLQLLPFWLNDSKKDASKGQALLRQLARYREGSSSTAAASAAPASSPRPVAPASAPPPASAPRLASLSRRSSAVGGDREVPVPAPSAPPAAPRRNGSFLKRRRPD
jgi:hypothetical protein